MTAMTIYSKNFEKFHFQPSGKREKVYIVSSLSHDQDSRMPVNGKNLKKKFFRTTGQIALKLDIASGQLVFRNLYK